MSFRKDILKIDPQKECDRITHFLEGQVARFRRDGIIVGLSGGIDSALMASLAVKAVGSARVLGLILPEMESNPASQSYAEKLADHLGIRHKVIDLTSTLKEVGVYEDRLETLKKLFPAYDDKYKYNIVLPQNLLEKDRFNISYLRLVGPSGDEHSFRLSKGDFLRLTAPANAKLRLRMLILYYYAEQDNLLVAGTTNKSEYLLGYFGKYGDGATDIEGLSHLYKTQIYALSGHVGVIEEIVNRDPSPDTYSLPVADKDFFFCLPFETLDMLLYAWANEVPMVEVCEVMGLTEEQVTRVFKDFEAKARATWHFRCLPPTVDDVDEEL